MKNRTYLYMVIGFVALGLVLLITGRNSGWPFLVWMAGCAALLWFVMRRIRADAAAPTSEDEAFRPQPHDRLS